MASLSVMDSAFCHATAGQDLASHVSVLVKDASKRKRVNRKLKQCKLDARRGQWLSQVTTIKHSTDSYQESSPSGKLDLGEVINHESHDNLDVGARDINHFSSEGFEKAFSPSHLRLISSEQFKHDDSKGDSGLSGPTSCISDCFGADVSPKSVGSSSPKSKMNRVGTDCGRGNRERSIMEVESKPETAGHVRGMSAAYDMVSEKTEGYSLDSEIEDWEAVADALGVSASRDGICNKSDSQKGVEEKVRLSLAHASLTEPKHYAGWSSREGISRSSSSRAWRLDDDHRPASLPNLSKQQSLPAHFSEQSQQSVGIQKDMEELLSGPSLCPICAEELDPTDSSFDPCTCGFQLCLFCHHRILSEDGRCPGCRRFYCSSSASRSGQPSFVSC